MPLVLRLSKDERHAQDRLVEPRTEENSLHGKKGIGDSSGLQYTIIFDFIKIFIEKNYCRIPALNISKAWKELRTKGPEATALKPIFSPIV